ncbi:F-box-like domain protein [Rhizoctonia solani AG-3 Rhs1AP]|uniref:F-box-like domain protein n=1 Tax=Rhizoctonia solani AG-3 Rhs1AP TaxID=1086054 RepID=X8J1S1_9AGAM|nr:F-box-like domain protein [Rhizoctonia solani AG-3 Rhs1AP]
MSNMSKDLKLEKSGRADAQVVPPINSLPAEALAHIFQFVLLPRSQPCFLERDRYSNYPDYPDALLRVCSRWRQVALTSPTLWSRIDIVLSNPAGQKMLERAKIFLERAGQSQLDLRIFDQPIRSRRPFFSRSNDEFSNEEGDDFDFEEDGLDDLEDDSEGSDDLSVLGHCFKNCLPGALRKLVLRVETDGGINLIIPSSQDSEAVWLPITILHISGRIRPPWESNAFKGLTDLRLSGPGFSSIPESQFVNILRSSPKLQILQLYVDIGKSSPLNASVEPIHLDDLEVLDIIENHREGAEFEMLTRWIALGQKPLCLILWCPLSSESAVNFFRRANVTELRVRLHGSSFESLEKLIDLSPQLRVLAVDGCGSRFNPRGASNTKSSHPVAQIDALHLQYSQIQIDSLQQIVQSWSIRKLTMWSSHIRRGMYGGVSHEEILALCPDVKILKRKEFTPIERWVKSIA